MSIDDGTILVTGGCGHLGAAVMRELGKSSRPVAFDLKPPAKADAPFIQGSVLALADLEAAMRGVDAVVHVAAIPYDEPAADREPGLVGERPALLVAVRHHPQQWYVETSPQLLDVRSLREACR